MENGNLAQFESTTLTVKYYRNANLQAQAEAILHELVHAAYDQGFGPSNRLDEENVVRFATATMLALLRDNPKEIQMLLDAIETGQ